MYHCEIDETDTNKSQLLIYITCTSILHPNLPTVSPTSIIPVSGSISLVMSFVNVVLPTPLAPARLFEVFIRKTKNKNKKNMRQQET